MDPPATIVVPLLRQNPDYLATSLRSALRQTVAGEVIVVTAPDTPSLEHAILRQAGTATAGGAHPERLRVVPSSRRGFAAALNDGFAAARADRIGILLTDDWLEPTALEASLVLDADIVTGGMTIWDAAGSRRLDHLVSLRTKATYDTLTDDLARAAHLSHFLLFRRAALEAVGGVDESLGDLAGVDDFDLPWSLLERGASVAFVGRSLYHVRDHPGERLTLRPRADALCSLRRILAKHRVSEEDQRAVLAGHGRWYGRTIQDAAG